MHVPAAASEFGHARFGRGLLELGHARSVPAPRNSAMHVPATSPRNLAMHVSAPPNDKNRHERPETGRLWELGSELGSELGHTHRQPVAIGDDRNGSARGWWPARCASPMREPAEPARRASPQSQSAEPDCRAKLRRQSARASFRRSPDGCTRRCQRTVRLGCVDLPPRVAMLTWLARLRQRASIVSPTKGVSSQLRNGVPASQLMRSDGCNGSAPR